uniref:Ribosomal protein S7 n=1 Tax=Kryptoperidinium foliaceum endosymbiont TaxID=1079369 RepID=I6N5R5_9STRA|nr:ribosomal protein S7 [Kryptoperidinium foliaceum endosymbiont]
MIKSLRTKKLFNLKTKIVNVLMTSGKKNTGEKILLKFAKKLQKSNAKRFKKVVQLAIINTTPTFKLNEQVVKKGKRKAVRNTPSFIISDSLRIMTSLKSIKHSVSKSKNAKYFYENLVNEIIMSSNLKGPSVDKKTELQKRILANKRYLSNFRW